MERNPDCGCAAHPSHDGCSPACFLSACRRSSVQTGGFTIPVAWHAFTIEGVTTGAGMVVQERRRQVEQEGYSPEHDRGQRWAITRAGIAYAIASLSTLTDDQHDEAWAWWPWSTEAWKPKDALADLVRAGALIAAAIDAMLASEPGLVAEDAAIARMVDDEYEARFETASDGGEM